MAEGEGTSSSLGSQRSPPSQGSQPSLVLSGIVRGYGTGEAALDVLRGADLDLRPGQSVALVAPSGTGKSTLLHVAGLLERPQAGEVFVAGRPTLDLDMGGIVPRSKFARFVNWLRDRV